MAATKTKETDKVAPKTEESKPKVEVIRPETLASELGVSGKQVRGFLRATFPRAPEQKRSSWNLTQQQADAVRTRFLPKDDETEVSE
jgi:hypothetical protein